MVESAIQKLLILTLFFGESLMESDGWHDRLTCQTIWQYRFKWKLLDRWNLFAYLRSRGIFYCMAVLIVP